MRKIGVLFAALLPSRQRACGQRTDHLRHIEPLDGAVLEIDEHGAGKVRHDGALAGAGRAHADLCLHLAVELVEIGRTFQKRQCAHADEIAAQRINRIAARRVDNDVAAGLAAIGAEIGKPGFQHAIGEAGIDRGRREARLADIDFGGGNFGLGIDIVQPGEVDRRIAPGLRAQ